MFDSGHSKDDPCFVYFLRCPDTGEVRYVGITKNPQSRFTQHFSQSNKGCDKCKWITELRSQGKRPVMQVVLGAFPRSNALAIEARLVREMALSGARIFNKDAQGVVQRIHPSEVSHLSASNQFVALLRNWRDTGGSITDLVRKTGCSRQNIYTLLSGRRSPTCQTACLLMQACGYEYRIEDATPVASVPASPNFKS